MAIYIKIEELKEQRLKQKISVRSFADLINVSSRTIQSIEKNESVNISTIRAYLGGLNNSSKDEYKVIIEHKKKQLTKSKLSI